MFSEIVVSHAAPDVRQITLNRPRQFNALSSITFHELNLAMDEFVNSADRILILTGQGRAFCFGADFQEFVNRDKLPKLLDQFQNLIQKIYWCPKLTIAAINGFATGAGFDLALACDFRLSSDRVKIGEAYISMGLVSDGGGSFFLPKIVGISKAMELLLTGEPVDAQVAKELGIIHQVVAADQLAAASIEFAASLANKPQTALRLLKQLVKRNADTTLVEALKHEHEAQLACFNDPEHLALVQQQLERRSKKQES